VDNQAQNGRLLAGKAAQSDLPGDDGESVEADRLRSRPICVFDSGLGGLTVVGELSSALAGEDIVYLGDTARVPYGIKSLETIRRFAREDATFLMQFEPKMLVVACNTASAAAIDCLRELLAKTAVEVVDVIGPGAAAAVAATDKLIGVIATEATIKSGAYQRAIQKLSPGREVVAAACPLLVPIVEEGRAEDDPIVLHVLGDYLRELQRRRPGALILGCTHYPLLNRAIGKLMGPAVTLVSSGAAAAGEVRARLAAMKLASPRKTGGELRCFTTDNKERFAELGQRFLDGSGARIHSVQYVGTDELEKRPGHQGAEAQITG
jgi:glutamate racemase